MATPEWTPPAGMNPPVIRRLDIDRFSWEREIRGMLPAHMYPVALSLATFGSKEGDNAHPGEHRLADAIGVTTRTVRTALAWLDANGWITRTHLGGKSGSQRGLADAYRLTLPAPLAVKLGKWADDAPQWMKWRPDLKDRPWQP